MTETIEAMTTPIDQQQLAQDLVDKARAEGVGLVGPGGLLSGGDEDGARDGAGD